MSLLIVSALFTAGAAGITAYALGSHRKNQASLRRLRGHCRARVNMIQKNRMDLLEARNRNKLIEDTISGGTSAVELVHRTITTVTFEAIDRFSSSERTRASIRRARESHDETTRQIYRSVRSTNRAIHAVANTVLAGKTRKRIEQAHPTKKRERPDD